MTNPRTCEFCRFWSPWPERDQPASSEETFGDCRKHSPVLVVGGRGETKPRTKWPSTRRTDSCGDFRIDREMAEIGRDMADMGFSEKHEEGQR